MIGYRRGNWAYEWSQQAMLWQRKALEFESGEKACEAWLLAANLYSIAGYPHLKGMSWRIRLPFWQIRRMKTPPGLPHMN